MAKLSTSLCCAMLWLSLGTTAANLMGAERTSGTNLRGLSPVLSFDDLAYQRGKVVMRKVTITELDLNRKITMQVQADLAEATGIDFNDSNWSFHGKVIVTLPEGELHAEHAVVAFNRGRISTATVDGVPATFEQAVGSESAGATGINGARGHAQQISYDVASGEVHLTGEAWISDDAREISSQRIVYSILQHTVSADSGSAGGERVRGTIKPKARSATGTSVSPPAGAAP
jgi:lipopolysaccharide export system protein LptA